MAPMKVWVMGSASGSGPRPASLAQSIAFLEGLSLFPQHPRPVSAEELLQVEQGPNSLGIPHAKDPCRISADNGAGRNIFRHNSPHPDDRPVPHGNARTQRRAIPDPHPFSNADRPKVHFLVKGKTRRLLVPGHRGKDGHLRPEYRPLTDPDSPSSVQPAERPQVDAVVHVDLTPAQPDVNIQAHTPSDPSRLSPVPHPEEPIAERGHQLRSHKVEDPTGNPGQAVLRRNQGRPPRIGLASGRSPCRLLFVARKRRINRALLAEI